MTSAQLNAQLQTLRTNGAQLYADLNTNLAYSWNNSFDDMSNATITLCNSDYAAWQRVKQTQSQEVQGQFDLAWSTFGEWNIWLTMFTTAPGIEGWDPINGLVGASYQNNLDYFKRANNTWGSSPAGPPDLQNTVLAFCNLWTSAFVEPGFTLMWPKVRGGLLRFAFGNDVVKLFGLVHNYLPAPSSMPV
jgi:hypothetical protein